MPEYATMSFLCCFLKTPANQTWSDVLKNFFDITLTDELNAIAASTQISPEPTDDGPLSIAFTCLSFIRSRRTTHVGAGIHRMDRRSDKYPSIQWS